MPSCVPVCSHEVGIDEIVALTKIVQFGYRSGLEVKTDSMLFDRIVIDTAPTGHTIRLLQVKT